LRLAPSCTWVGLTYALDRDGLDWVGLGWTVGSTNAKVLKI